MIKLFYGVIPITPILLLISSVMIIFYISFYKKNVRLESIVTICSFLLSIITILCSRVFFLEYFSELVKIDQYSYFYIFMLLLSGLYTCIFVYPWLLYKNIHSTEFYAFILLSTIGGILVSISFHFSTLFIGIELLFFPLLGILIFFSKYKVNLFYILLYLITSVFSSVLLLLGFSFIYFISGRLSWSFFTYLFIYYPTIMHNNIMLLGICIILFAIFLKLSIFPLHTWSPGIYQYTNSCVLIYFSTVTKISLLSFLVRFFYYIPYFHKIKLLYLILYFIGIFSLLFGNIIAIIQNKIQRLIGYLSISNLGFLLLLITTCSQEKYIYMMKYLNVYIFSYLLGLLGFFGIKSIVDYNIYIKNIDDLEKNSLVGLFWYDPFLGIMMTIILLSLSGFPLTAGFWGKFFVFKNLIHNNFIITTICMMLSSIIGAYSYINIIFSLYCNPTILEKKYLLHHLKITVLQKYLIICIGIVLIFLGLFPKFIYKLFFYDLY
ncbi:NADH-quinone oxidoreductase subunit N [Buchnera aphidicola (Cinara cuneomaculata)]|uniref:NADH-quinone oxidoreductase subunit N n=1 Tax=Buchnera aphidicola (Cinara cuneomaculata) TaxID=1660040 RepID=A0A451CXP8_9GAMM|nr:proton-conducting transporter membrane subunit [Buchnera aphidicola]VFP78096.1 NADH-quinone oxidoreductase subunit N [Buchnera aphidicola (Cinara cuneomaculata)]